MTKLIVIMKDGNSYTYDSGKYTDDILFAMADSFMLNKMTSSVTVTKETYDER